MANSKFVSAGAAGKQALSEESVEILNTLTKTMSLLGMTFGIDLPRIVVIGNQSTGKSSVLESIVKREFLPRGQQTVTRCPIILQLHVVKENTPRPNGINPQASEWCILKDIAGNQNAFEKFNELSNAIRRKTEDIAGNGSAISDKPISVDVYAPNVLPLSLIDLPGMICYDGGVGDNASNLIYDMCKSYVSQKNVIIVAVSRADDETQLSQAFKLAKEVDKSGERTLAVFTKMDLAVNSGNTVETLEKYSADVAKLGVICIINRSQQQLDANMPIAECIQLEKQYFQGVCPKVVHRHGTPYLEAKLSELMKKHMMNYFPELSAKLRTTIDEKQNALNKLTDPPPENERAKLLAKYIHYYVQAYNMSIGDYAFDPGRIPAGPNIRRILYKKLPEELDKIEAFDDKLNDDAIMRVIDVCCGPWPPTMMNEKVLRELIRKRIEAFEPIATECAENVYSELLNEAAACLSNIPELNQIVNNFPAIKQRLIGETTTLLQGRRPTMIKDLKELFLRESACPNTGNVDVYQKFMDMVAAAGKKNPGYEANAEEPHANLFKNQLELQKEQFKLYFDVVRKALKDSLVKTIFSVLITFMQNMLPQTLYSNMMVLADDEAEALWQQGENVENERRDLKVILEVLHNAEEVISNPNKPKPGDSKQSTGGKPTTDNGVDTIAIRQKRNNVSPSNNANNRKNQEATSPRE